MNIALALMVVVIGLFLVNIMGAKGLILRRLAIEDGFEGSAT